MSVETLRLLSSVLFIGFCILFLVCVILFFSLKIKSIISELLGKSQKKAIAKIHKQHIDQRPVTIKDEYYSDSLQQADKACTVKLSSADTEILHNDANATVILTSAEDNKNDTFDLNDRYTDTPEIYGFYVEADIIMCEDTGI